MAMNVPSAGFTDTSGSLAREAGVTVVTVNLYAKLGLLEYVVAANGVKMFRVGQAERVREILAERRGNRGRRPA